MDSSKLKFTLCTKEGDWRMKDQANEEFFPQKRIFSGTQYT